MSLKTDYTNDIFYGNRKYNMITNSDGTVSFTDVTEYTSEGDTFSASDINSVNEVINALDTKIGSSTLETAAQDLSDAVNDLNSNKAVKSHASKTTDFGIGTSASYGHLKITDTLSSTAMDAALTANAGKRLNDTMEGKAPNSHASTASTYGLGTTGSYGHVKTINWLSQSVHEDGLALSAYQGFVLDNNKAPNSHASTTTTYGKATSSNYGHVRLTDSITWASADEDYGIAASGNAVKLLNDAKLDKTSMSVSGTTLNITL